MDKYTIRFALGLVSFAVIGLELAFMRTLALRFYQHFAHMVISVALLGFGASGTALTLLRRRIEAQRRSWMLGFCVAFAVSIPVAHAVCQSLPFHVEFLAWFRTGAIPAVGALQLAVFLPFLFAGAIIGTAMMGENSLIGGHYAASMTGSGIGAIGAVLLMGVLNAQDLLTVLAGLACLAAILLAKLRSLAHAATVAVAALATLLSAFLAAAPPAMSAYKTLPLAQAMPGSRVLFTDEGPMGRVDVLECPALHPNPGLSLRYTRALPPSRLILLDGEQLGAVYQVSSLEDWRFLDYTTRASAFRLVERPNVLVVGAGGGEDIGLALFHRSRAVTALEVNPLVIRAMAEALDGLGGEIYRATSVHLVNQEARGFLRRSSENYDIIMLPPLEAYGASGAGLYATSESYLYTVEAFYDMLRRLSERGVLCVTRWARIPPREELKVLDTARAALLRMGKEPQLHLAMIRNYLTVTVLVSRRQLGARDCDALRHFCEERDFDVGYVPDAVPVEEKLFHLVPEASYTDAARALLGPKRENFLRAYLYDVRAATDDRPYYFHFLRWRTLPALPRQLRGHTPAFLEIGPLLLVAALLQAVVFSVLFVLSPLLPRMGGLRVSRQTGATLGLFLLIGIGFMFLEMAFLQRFFLYLAHPIYAASAVIGGFLTFAGLGSLTSRLWTSRPVLVTAMAAGATAIGGTLYLILLPKWLSLTQGAPLQARYIVGLLTIFPLAFCMGHSFPTALRHLGEASPSLVPWAWAVNGCASVLAVLLAPVLTMSAGFTALTLSALASYAGAGILALRLARSERAFASGN